MNAIKEFLKPNKWKVFICIVLAGTFLLALSQGFPDLSGAKNPYFGLFGIHSTPVLIIWSVIIAGKIERIMTDIILWGMLIVYWYLFSCLTYSIFLKLKEKFLKNSPQTTS